MEYESAKIEIVYIEASDVIVTSGNISTDSIGSDGRYDYDGWT